VNTASETLVQGPDALYGAAESGGVAQGEAIFGAIFKVTPSGTFTPLYGFTNGNDGETPYAGLVFGRDGNFYGTSIHGTAGYGAVFQMTPAGSLKVLLDFDWTNGAGPVGTLIQGADGNLYAKRRAQW